MSLMQVNLRQVRRNPSAGGGFRRGLTRIKAPPRRAVHAGAMAYLTLLLCHLLAAIAFAGTVLVEVLLLPGCAGACPRPPPAALSGLRRAGPQADAGGAGAAVRGRDRPYFKHHRGALARPLPSTFGLLLSIKIALAASVFCHFLAAMHWQRHGRLDGPRSQRLHRSVLLHVLAIAILTKAMFHL